MEDGSNCPYLDGVPCIIRWNGAVYKRPIMPIDSWQNINITQITSTDGTIDTTINDAFIDKPSQKPSQTKALMTSLLEKSRPSSDTEARLIVDSMSHMIELVMADLSQKYKMFEKCRLLKTGSVFEGAKLGPPDEFDFMIDLPSLGKYTQLMVDGVSRLTASSHLVTIDVSSSEIFSDLFPNSHRIILEKSKYCPLIRNAWYRRLYHVIGDSMQEALPAGLHWEPVNILQDWMVDNGKVFTYNFRWDGDCYRKLHVTMDVVLSVPLNETLECSPDAAGKYAADSLSGNQDIVYGDDSELRVIMAHPCVKQVRVTSSVLETVILNDPSHQEAIIVLRMAKLLALRCIGRHLDRNTHRFISRLPTYWIKTVWLYMLARYPSDSWVGQQNQQDRLLEIFQTIQQCLNFKWMSSFFIPGYNVMTFKGMSSLALGFSHTNHMQTLFEGVHHCIKTLTSAKKPPKFATSDDELTNLRLKPLFFYVIRQRNVWSENLTADQQLCKQDAGGRDADTIEKGLKAYISTYFPSTFELRWVDNEWCLYKGRRRVNIHADYEDIRDGKYFMDQKDDGSLPFSVLRKAFPSVAAFGGDT